MRMGDFKYIFSSLTVKTVQISTSWHIKQVSEREYHVIFILKNNLILSFCQRRQQQGE